MRRSESWARGKITQNSMMRVAHFGVVSKFGSISQARRRRRKKDQKDDRFVVGETEVGGGEMI